ncbi:hypothetical protein L0657_19265 [Dyadobacter sp. CY345]|uniref:hypothetical protein n=1 Tax=Dyadobacter sp. CY345 TaxID=2909335 RepID=UPI001F19D91B|nr:hypothetical protein [Dyadobacter sp. CY345]MCF2446106.1 hypothetical protein [Dyadobacter sp. CY345]
MIFKFNPKVFDIDDSLVGRDILALILNFFKDLYLWDEENLYEIFGDPTSESLFFETRFAETILTADMRNQIRGHLKELFLKSAYITSAQKFYLTTICIGVEADEVRPADALKITNTSSLVLVENGTNDWNFIKGLVKNYKKHPKRKEIYKLISKALDEHTLIENHAGGSGEMVKRLKAIVEGDLAEVFKFKVLVLFDSDRNDDKSINFEKWRTLLEYIKGSTFNENNSAEWIWKESDLLRWHMLYKRELENYLSSEMLIEALDVNTAISATILGLGPRDLDFYRFSQHMDQGMKNQIPTLFMNDGLREVLENRCSHHRVPLDLPNGILEEVSEVEKLLLNIAKII